jgi:hypothetical protein
MHFYTYNIMSTRCVKNDKRDKQGFVGEKRSISRSSFHCDCKYMYRYVYTYIQRREIAVKKKICHQFINKTTFSIL